MSKGSIWLTCANIGTLCRHLKTLIWVSLHALRDLETLPGKYSYQVICGRTGSGKSRLLEALARNGQQVLDLEKLAAHKGSVLGDLPHEVQLSDSPHG